ncbi:MAG: PAS domain S-box protein [bacterium]
MPDKNKTQEQLFQENAILRQRIVELEALDAERNRTEDALRQSERELSVRNRINGIFLAIPDDEMYGEVLQVILEITESPYGFFGYINQQGDLVCPSLSKDIWDQCQIPDKDIIFPRKNWDGLWGRSLIAKKSLYSNGPLHVPEGHIFLSRALVVPVIHQKKIIGQLAVANKAADYTQKDQNLLETIADYIAPVLHARLQRDIQESERRRSERDLRESEGKYSTLVEQAKDCVVILQEGYFKFVNKAVEDIIGYKPEELMDKPLQNILVPEYRELLAQRRELRLAGEKVPSVYEIKVICKDGKIKDGEVSISLIQYHGKPATMAIARDITERKKTEEELLKIQKLESLGTLAGGIAHDFNNLLAAGIGALSLLELEAAEYGENVSSLLEIIKTACQKAKNLTRQLLTFASGGAPVKTAVSLAKLMQDTISFALSGSQAKCELSIPADLWWTEIDQDQIGQAIHNIIINAEQALAGGGIIKVRAENVTVETQNSLSLKEGKYVKVLIQDQGVGIPEEIMPKIFDPYFTTKQSGSGLGLAITYAIIKKHEGYIGVESQPGVGTTLYFYLPSSEKRIHMVKDVKEKQFHCGQGKILVMDDQQLVKATIGRMLTCLGYEVAFAADGAEAIELYKKAKESGSAFDIVILDLTIPGGMGGAETIRKLLEIDPDVKSIVSSGYSNAPIMSEYQKHGFKGVVTKPYEMKELSEIVYKVLKE